MRKIVFFPIIVSGHLHNVSTALSAFPGHIVASESNYRIFMRIMTANLLHKHPADFRTAYVCMHIIDLISDGPHNHTGMASVSPYPGGNILLLAPGEKTGIIVLRFCSFPHIKGFINNKNPQLIAEIQQLGCRRVMGSSQCICTHFLHQKQLPAGCFFVKSGPQCPKIMMQTHTVQLEAAMIQ